MHILLKNFFNTYCSTIAGGTVVIGFSGGPDSMALLHAMVTIAPDYKLTIVAAHFNHQWRAAADGDALWCANQAHALGVIFECATRTQYEHRVTHNGSQEAYGRAMRRLFFTDICEKYHADYVFLAHHQDDQEENFFIRLLRGTTLTGLVGMRVITGCYVRPLLGVRKEALYEYLALHKLSYLVDETNSSDEYLRNRIRNSVIPALRGADPRYDSNMQLLLNRLAETEDYLTTLTEEYFNQIKIIDESVVPACAGIQKNLFLRHERFMQRRLLVHWFSVARFPVVPSESFLDEIVRYIAKSSAKTHAIKNGWYLAHKDYSVYLVKLSVV